MKLEIWGVKSAWLYLATNELLATGGLELDASCERTNIFEYFL